MSFDIIGGGISTFNQTMMIILGLVFFLIGGGLIAFRIYQRFTGIQVKGKIIGVRAESRSVLRDQMIENMQSATPAPMPTVQKSSSSFALVLLLVFPLIFIGAGAYFGLDYGLLKAHGARATAQVVDIESRDSSNNGKTYAAVYSYTDINGNGHRRVDRVSTGGGNKIPIGSTQDILYDPTNPDHFAVDSFWHNMILPIAFIIGGGVFIFIPGWASRRQARAAANPSSSLKYNTQDMYYPVFEYAAPDGHVIQSEGDTGSNSLADKIPGTAVNLVIRSDDFESVTRSGIFLYIFGLLFALPGLIILAIGVSEFKWTSATPFVILAMIAYAIFRLSRIIKPRAMWDTRESFRAKIKLNRQAKTNSGRLLSLAEFNTLLTSADRSSSHYLPVVAIIAVLMCGGGVFWCQHQAMFEQGAVPAQGHITRFESKYNDGHTYYYADVQFVTTSGNTIEFRDNMGSNMPTRRLGETVNVLYDPTSPANAMIDRGWLNRLPGIGLGLVGLLLLWGTLRNLAAVHRRMRRL